MDKRELAFRAIFEAAKELGWEIYVEENFTLDDCHGLLMGTVEWCAETDEVSNG